MTSFWINLDRVHMTSFWSNLDQVHMTSFWSNLDRELELGIKEISTLNIPVHSV
jgi:hypothetical protein